MDVPLATLARTTKTQKSNKQSTHTIRSILCGEERWIHDSAAADSFYIGSYIHFNENGSGILMLSGDQHADFACDFDWNHETLDVNRPVQLVEAWLDKTQVVAEFVVEIAFRTTGENKFALPNGGWSWRIAGPYHKQAPRPRVFHVRLEKGLSDIPVVNDRSVPHFNNGLRLTFETSPYGTRQAWGMMDIPFWEIKEFVARRSEASQLQSIFVKHLSENCVVS